MELLLRAPNFVNPSPATASAWFQDRQVETGLRCHVTDVQGEIDTYTAPRPRELLIDLVSKGSYQLVVNLDPRTAAP